MKNWPQAQTKEPNVEGRPTCADKLLLLHLGHIVSPQVRRGHALSVKAQTGALSQPLGQPGYMTVALQVVGVQAAKKEKRQMVGRIMDEETDRRKESRHEEDGA